MTKVRRFVASLLVVSVAALGIPLPAHAGIIATDTLVAAGDRERIASILERAEVRAQLEVYGVNAGLVKARVAALTDDEVAQLAQQMDSLPAGGNGGLGPVVGAIVLIFLVLLITDILGLTKVFPFTRAQR